MQSFTDITADKLISDSRQPLLDNDRTVLSCNSGTAFPVANLIVGMLCLRTDQLKMYQLRDLTPTWVLIVDLLKTLITKEDVIARYTTIGHHHIKSEIDDFAHTHVGTDIAVATATTRGVVQVGAGLKVDANGRVDIDLPTNLVMYAPAQPKNGSITTSGDIIYMYSNGSYKQIWPAVYGNG